MKISQDIRKDAERLAGMEAKKTEFIEAAKPSTSPPRPPSSRMPGPRPALDAIGQTPDVEIDIAAARPPTRPRRRPRSRLASRRHPPLNPRPRRHRPRPPTRRRRPPRTRRSPRRPHRRPPPLPRRHPNLRRPGQHNLIQVIERRRGIPVTLGILWLHCTRVIGWPAHGLDFPGHFLLALEGEPTQSTTRKGPHQTVLDVFARRHPPRRPRPSAPSSSASKAPNAELRPGVLTPMPARRRPPPPPGKHPPPPPHPRRHRRRPHLHPRHAPDRPRHRPPLARSRPTPPTPRPGRRRPPMLRPPPRARPQRQNRRPNPNRHRRPPQPPQLN